MCAHVCVLTYVCMSVNNADLYSHMCTYMLTYVCVLIACIHGSDCMCVGVCAHTWYVSTCVYMHASVHV
jgi:hypothetical protein